MVHLRRAGEPAAVRGAARLLRSTALSYAQAGARFGYTRWATDQPGPRAPGRRSWSCSPRPASPARPPGTAPAKDRARGRVDRAAPAGPVGTYEISRRLAAEGTPLNRTSVAEILAEEGFGRLLRAPRARGQHLPGHRRPRHDPARAPTVIDFAYLARTGWTPPGPGCCWPSRTWSSLDLPALAAAAGYPGTRVIPADLLAAVPAGAQAHPHPAGLPRR